MSLLRFSRRHPMLDALFKPARPTLAAELTDEHFALVRVGRGPTGPQLVAYLVAAPEERSVRTSPVAANISAPEALGLVVRAARERVAPGGGAVALCIPDAAARVALIASDALPRKREDVRDMIAWRLKKTLPYRTDEAHVGWQAFTTPAGRHLLLATTIRKRVLQEYESLLAAAGFEVGSVTLSTLALADLVPEGGAGDTLLLNVGVGWFSMLITNENGPLFYRCKVLPENERTGAERDWFVAGEIFPTLEFYRSKLSGTGITRALLHVSGSGWDALRDTLATSLETPIEPLWRAPLGDVPPEAAARLGPAMALASRGLRRETATAGRQP